MNNRNPIFDLPYEDLLAYLEEVIEGKRELNEQREIIDHLLLVCLNEIDFGLASKLCQKFIKNEDYYVKGMAIMGIGHIARVYGQLVEKELYNKIVDIYRDRNSEFWEHASDTLNDIRMFLKIPQPDYD